MFRLVMFLLPSFQIRFLNSFQTCLGRFEGSLPFGHSDIQWVPLPTTRYSLRYFSYVSIPSIFVSRIFQHFLRRIANETLVWFFPSVCGTLTVLNIHVPGSLPQFHIVARFKSLDILNPVKGLRLWDPYLVKLDCVPCWGLSPHHSHGEFSLMLKSTLSILTTSWTTFTSL